MTKGKVIVMGRGTFLSLPSGKPLPDRVNIVLSADKTFAAEGAAVCRSLGELKEELKKYDTSDVFVFGGQAVYKELLEYCKFAYVTKYDRAFEADRFFPDIEKAAGWKLVETPERGSHEGYGFTINLYENMQCKPL